MNADAIVTGHWLASVQQRGLHSLERRMRQGATLLGLDFEAYRQQIQAGNKWCSGHKRFEPRSGFGRHIRRPDGLNTICRAWDRSSALVRWRRRAS